MSSSPSAAGASSPVTHETCEQATSVVRRADGVGELLRAATAVTFTPRARATTSGPSRPGCSLSAVTISSPGPEVEPGEHARRARRWSSVFSATSATAAPSARAYASRSASLAVAPRLEVRRRTGPRPRCAVERRARGVGGRRAAPARTCPAFR